MSAIITHGIIDGAGSSCDPADIPSSYPLPTLLTIAVLSREDCTHCIDQKTSDTPVKASGNTDRVFKDESQTTDLVLGQFRCLITDL